MMKTTRLSLLTCGVLALMLGVASNANATLMLRLSDGLTTVDVIDGGGLDTAAATTGLLSYAGSIGAFDFTSTVGSSKPFVGSSEMPVLDLFSVDITSNLSSGSFPSTLYLYLTDTDFTHATNPAAGFVGGTTDGSASFASYLDTTNTPFGTENLLDTTNVLSSGAFSDQFTKYGVDTSGGPYSLTIYAAVTHSGTGQLTSFDYQLKVPEPPTVALLGLGLLGLGLLARRRNAAT